MSRLSVNCLLAKLAASICILFSVKKTLSKISFIWFSTTTDGPGYGSEPQKSTFFRLGCSRTAISADTDEIEFFRECWFTCSSEIRV